MKFDVAEFLLEAEIEHPNDRLFADRLVLRLFSFPALMAHLVDVGSIEEGVLEIVFRKFPTQILPQVLKLIGVKDKDIETFRFESGGHPMLGFRIDVPPDETKKSAQGAKTML